MPNLALIEARRVSGLSQYDLAREIRRYGFMHGRQTGCTRELVHKWESGRTRRPHPCHQVALEHVLGLPIENLGFDADLRYDISRAQVLEQAGLDAPLQLPDPAGSYGPLSGIWLSEYAYASSGRKGTFSSRHYVVVLQAGAQLMVRSVPASASAVSMQLFASGRVITGTWTERTRLDGYYRGAVYTGALQMLEREPGQRWEGRWVGFGKNDEINDGPWSVGRVSDRLTREAISEYDVPLD